MRIRLSAPLLLLLAITASCQPDKKCGGQLYYDPVATVCRLCPKEATFKNGTCVCQEQYEFVKNRCKLMDGAVIEAPDASAPPVASGGCTDYCDFAKVCIGDSTLSKAALPDVVAGLHADDKAACTSSCQSDLGDDGSSDPVVACIEAGREAAACAGDNSQNGLLAAFTLIGDCCQLHRGHALCKSICVPLKANAFAANMFDFCN